MRALDSQTLSTTATCFQCDGDGRRAGLKIRSSQEGVGSSPTFGTIYLRQIATCRFALQWEQIGNSVAVILEPQRWLELKSGADSYRIHFRYHGKQHFDPRQSLRRRSQVQIRPGWRFLTSISTPR